MPPLRPNEGLSYFDYRSCFSAYVNICRSNRYPFEEIRAEPSDEQAASEHKLPVGLEPHPT